MFIFRKGIESTEVVDNGYLAPKDDPKYFTPHFDIRPITSLSGNVVYYERKFNDAVFYKLPFARTTLDVNGNFVQKSWMGKQKLSIIYTKEIMKIKEFIICLHIWYNNPYQLPKRHCLG